MSSNDRYDLARDVKPGDIVCCRWNSTPFFVVGVEYRRYIGGERVKTSFAAAEIVVVTAIDYLGILVLRLEIADAVMIIVRAERE
jgi:hypothetical protein